MIRICLAAVRQVERDGVSCTVKFYLLLLEQLTI